MKVYGLIGRPLTHSFSKTYFSEKFSKEEIRDCVYENFPLNTIEELTTLINSRSDLKGLNVTIPYKEQVLPFLHEQNDVVKEIGACNCIRIKGGKLYGFNTDVIGFTQSLQPHLKPHHTKALILGTGGAAKAVEYSLKPLGIEYRLVSRDRSKGMTYSDIDEKVLSEHLLIINTTPVGMHPNVDDAPNLPYQFLSTGHLLFDLIYNPAKTKFLLQGEKRGATVLNGHQMLIIQAEESWKIWNS
jgi:shikimate dehydrogenase